MGLVEYGGGVAQISGKVGGTVFSHNKGGAYARGWSIPINPGTPQQSAVRALMSQLTALWRDILTSVQRIAWDEYAANVPLPNRFGQPRDVGGLGMYIRGNLGRLQAGMTRIDDGPVIFNLGDFTAPVVLSATASTDIISLGFTNTDEWANEDDAAMLVYTGRQQNPSINFFKGPYRFARAIPGDGITPPTSPDDFISAFAMDVGTRVFLRARVTRADGRLSSDFRTEAFPA